MSSSHEAGQKGLNHMGSSAPCICYGCCTLTASVRYRSVFPPTVLISDPCLVRSSDAPNHSRSLLQHCTFKYGSSDQTVSFENKLSHQTGRVPTYPLAHIVCATNCSATCKNASSHFAIFFSCSGCLLCACNVEKKNATRLVSSCSHSEHSPGVRA